MPLVCKRKRQASSPHRENMKKAVRAFIKKEGALRGIAENFGVV